MLTNMLLVAEYEPDGNAFTLLLDAGKPITKNPTPFTAPLLPASRWTMTR